MSAPLGVYALGLSPPEVQIDYLPVGSLYTVSATLFRAPEEASGDLNVTVTARKSAAGFFHGDSSFIMPDGTREATYLYNIIPDYPSAVDQELYVTFLLQPISASVGAVSIISGVTQVVRFTTDIVASPQTTSPTPEGASSGGGSRSVRGSPKQPDESTDDTDTDSGSQTQEQTTDGDLNSVPTSTPATSQQTQDGSSSAESSDVQITPKQTLTRPFDFGRVIESPSIENLSLPRAINLQSSTHPFSEQFYRGNGVMLSWQEPGQSVNTSYRFVLNYDSLVELKELVNETQNPSIFYEGLPDGIYYFHIMDISNIESGISTLKIKIDNTPPSVVPTLVSRQVLFFLPPRRFILLDIVDVLAGVAQVQVSINGAPVEITDAGVSLRRFGFGRHMFSVQAVDAAGNETVSQYVVEIAPRFPIAQTMRRIISTLLNFFPSFFNKL